MSSTDVQTGFQKPEFNHLVMTKIRLVLVLLSLGFNVLLNDVDIVWLEDPIPHMPLDADLVGQNGALFRPKLGFDVRNEAINTGFYFVKSNHRTINFMK